MSENTTKKTSPAKKATTKKAAGKKATSPAKKATPSATAKKTSSAKKTAPKAQAKKATPAKTAPSSAKTTATAKKSSSAPARGAHPGLGMPEPREVIAAVKASPEELKKNLSLAPSAVASATEAVQKQLTSVQREAASTFKRRSRKQGPAVAAVLTPPIVAAKMVRAGAETAKKLVEAQRDRTLRS